VNSSGVDFGADPGKPGAPGAIRYSLAALKNIGQSAVETIVRSRDEAGPFKDLSDFARRLNPKALNKRGLETLAMAGAFDAFQTNRALVHGNVDQMIALAQRLEANSAAGTSDLFGGGGGNAAVGLDLRPVTAWTPMERLDKEFAAVGFFLSGHPLDEYEAVLSSLGVKRWTEFEAAMERGAMGGRLAAIVVSARERKSQKGNKFAFAVFSDQTGQFEAVIFSDTLAAAGDLLTPGTAVVVSVEAERDGETIKMRVQGIESLDRAAASVQRGWLILLDGRELRRNPKLLDDLKARLVPGGANGIKGGEIVLDVQLYERDRALSIALKGKWDVTPNRKGHVVTLPGVIEVRNA
jgi:DNA polymerase-3 subunit alpha